MKKFDSLTIVELISITGMVVFGFMVALGCVLHLLGR